MTLDLVVVILLTGTDLRLVEDAATAVGLNLLVLARLLDVALFVHNASF